MTTLPATPSEASGLHTEAQTPWETLIEKLRELLADKATGTFSFLGSNFGQIDVDLGSRTYSSDVELADLPIQAEDVATRYIEESTPAEKPLDALLWRLGGLAYGATVPDWLPSQASFSLERWPSFQGFTPTPTEVRLISMLTSNKLTFRELASSTSVAPNEAHQLVSKLSLLGLITVAQRDANATKQSTLNTRGLPTHRPGGLKTPVTTLRERTETPELVRPVSVFESRAAKVSNALPELDLELVPVDALPVSEDKIQEAQASNAPKAEVSDSPAELQARDIEAPVAVPPTRIPTRPTVAAPLFPAFDPSAPPAPVKQRETPARNPNVKLESSFLDLIVSKEEDSDTNKVKPESKVRGRFLGKVRKD